MTCTSSGDQVMSLGRRHGVLTPANAAILDLVVTAETAAAGLPMLSPEHLLRAITQARRTTLDGHGVV